MTPAAHLRRGPLYMVLAALCFTLMIGSVKVARAELSAYELIVWRGLISLPIAGWMVRRIGLGVVNRRVLALRAALGFTAMTAFFSAARGLSVADLALIGKLQPLVVAIGAGALLGQAERIGPRLWLALGAGLAGCAILIGPELSVGSVWGLWALLAAFASGGAHLCVRVLGRTDDPRVQVFWFQAALIPLGLLAYAVMQGGLPSVPRLELWPWVLACGVFATLGQLLMTRAYALDRAATVAGASYAGPLWAVLLDVVAFGLVPGWDALFGGALVIGAGLALVYRRAEPPPRGALAFGRGGR